MRRGEPGALAGATGTGDFAVGSYLAPDSIEIPVALSESALPPLRLYIRLPAQPWEWTSCGINIETALGIETRGRA